MLGNLARRAVRPRTSEDLAANLSWGNPIELATIEARLMGSAPVCFNAAKWMAVDEYGRGFLVHVERASPGTPSFALILHVFDVQDPSRLSISHRIAPSRYSSGLGAPCLAISSGPVETRFVIACLGKPVGATHYESIHVASGTLSAPLPSRRTSPLLNVYNVLELQPTYTQLYNPSLFMDNDDQVHLVYTAEIQGTPLPTFIEYARAEWRGDPNTWRWGIRTLDVLDHDLRNPSVAARWEDGQLTVVVACKVARQAGYPPHDDASAVYVNVATGQGRLQHWRGWEFLAGYPVLSGTPARSEDDNSCADPSVWVAEDGIFYIGYQERVVVQTLPVAIISVYPRVAANPAPESANSSWTTHPMGGDGTDLLDQFVSVAGNGEHALCVRESRETSIRYPARWASAVALLSDTTSPDWVISDPTSAWGLDVHTDTGRDALLFPTCYVTDSLFVVAWLYVDRDQDGAAQAGPLDSPLRWPMASAGEMVSIQLLVATIP